MIIRKIIPIDKSVNIPHEIENFSKQFRTENNSFKFITQGLFGYITYDGIQYFEKLSINKKSIDNEIPDIYYAIYQNIIAINHFKNEAYIFCHNLDNKSNIPEVEQLLQSKNFASFAFSKAGNSKSNLNDEEFKKYVATAKQHCQLGDVFQLVLSHAFHRSLKAMSLTFIAHFVALTHHLTFFILITVALKYSDLPQKHNLLLKMLLLKFILLRELSGVRVMTNTMQN